MPIIITIIIKFRIKIFYSCRLYNYHGLILIIYAVIVIDIIEGCVTALQIFADWVMYVNKTSQLYWAYYCVLSPCLRHIALLLCLCISAARALIHNKLVIFQDGIIPLFSITRQDDKLSSVKLSNIKGSCVSMNHNVIIFRISPLWILWCQSKLEMCRMPFCLLLWSKVSEKKLQTT